MNRIMNAALWAAEIHRDQRRKGKRREPYVNHVLEVAELVTQAGFYTDDMIIAALLHDAVEDQKIPPEEIERRYGRNVRKLVDELTDDKSLPKQTRKDLQISHAPNASSEAKKIKLADKIANLRDMVRDPPSHWSKERCLKYVDWSREVIKALGPVDANLSKEFNDAHGKARSFFHT